MDREALASELARLPNWGSPGIECGIRAGFRCEHCGRDLLASLDDYKAWQQDHLVPRSLGGPDTLDNMVAACHPCHVRKGNQTPHEAGMPLLLHPHKPSRITYFQKFVRKHQDAWRPYLFMEPKT